MAIDFGRAFGAQSNNGAAQSQGGTRADQPKAKVWLNVGYVVSNVPTGQVDDKGKAIVEDRFVSLPVGIPLDTMEKLPTNARNESFAQFQAARNDLYDQLMGEAEKLAPGEDLTIGIGAGLSIQIRRVAEERQNIVSDESNPFGMKLELRETPAE